MSRRKRPGVLGVIVTIVVLAAVATGIFLIGSPAQERARRTDQRRVADLTGVAVAVDLYWSRKASLPQSLQDLAKEPGATVRINDPSTGESYEYRSLDGAGYEVCARFENDSGETAGPMGANSWSHGSGRHCFRREAQKIPGLSAQ